MATPDYVERVKKMIAAVTRNDPELKRALRHDTWSHNRTWMIGRYEGLEERGLPVATWTRRQQAVD
jgi:hypothetical protein